MSWTLSCLSLREHYDEVVLYTDTAGNPRSDDEKPLNVVSYLGLGREMLFPTEGQRILIDELHLPYTDVQVVFDDFPCLPQH